jgi:hypothetical protein
MYHWERVDEVAVDGVERPRVVVRRRADRRQVYRLRRSNRHESRRTKSSIAWQNFRDNERAIRSGIGEYIVR